MGWELEDEFEWIISYWQRMTEVKCKNVKT
jgi:hypothetical protein